MKFTLLFVGIMRYGQRYSRTSRYTESSLVLTGDKAEHRYIDCSLENVTALTGGVGIQCLPKRSDIVDLLAPSTCGGSSGERGYVNKNSGWADAEAAVAFAFDKVCRLKRVEFITAVVERLLFSEPSAETGQREVQGAQLADGSVRRADLTILSAGAWTPSLLDMRGIASSSGQVLGYVDLTPEEQEVISKMPVVLNLSTGLFAIPPPAPGEEAGPMPEGQGGIDWRKTRAVLKVARHGYGYQNPVDIENPEPRWSERRRTHYPWTSKITPSLPYTSWDHKGESSKFPAEAEKDLSSILSELVPSLAGKAFSNTRICWYLDTASGDFIVTYHPRYKNLFVATGGSGHAFKFLPVLGDEVVKIIEDGPDGAKKSTLGKKWKWPEECKKQCVITEDGSRGGRRGMFLREEMAR
jgi:sarcosine oxidase / L-pipecolate oxidase